MKKILENIIDLIVVLALFTAAIYGTAVSVSKWQEQQHQRRMEKLFMVG